MSTNKIDNRMITVVAFLAVLALIAKPVWDGRHQWQFGQGYDDGIYMVSAKSLAMGEGYRHANIPGHPYATKYPPLYPLFLAAAWKMTPDFPRTLETASILQACLLPIYLALLFLVLRQVGLSWRRTFLVAALTFVSFSFVFLTVNLFSELLFGCFLLGSIWSVERAVDSDGAWWALAGGFLASAAYLTRNAALPLFLAVPIFLFLRKKPRLSVFFFGCVVPVVIGWHSWGVAHATAGVKTPYLDEYLRAVRMGGFGPHLMTQMANLSAAVAEEVFPGIIRYLFGIPLHHLALAAALVGGVRIGRRREWPLALIFTGLYLIMIVCWWFPGIGRLMDPVWPVLLVGIAEEVSHFATLLAQSIKNQKWQAAPRWALIGLGFCFLIRNDAVTWERMASIYSTEQKDRVTDLKAYRWITEHAPPDSVLLAWKDTVSYLYTGIPSSHDLFVATIPRAEEVTLRPEFHWPREQFKQAVVLLLASDLGADSSERIESFRATVESVPGATLEYRAPGAYVYRFPLQ